MLHSLRIQGFRAFQELNVPTLGRVNLIVGRNNVGKTTLLEAVHLLHSGSSIWRAATALLERRDEFQMESSARATDLAALFFRESEGMVHISIGSLDGENTLEIVPQWRIREEREENGVTYKFMDEASDDVDADPVLSAFHAGKRKSISLEAQGPRMAAGRLNSLGGPERSMFLPLAGFRFNEIDAARLWDQIALTENEESVLEALRVIEPDLERLVMVDSPHNRGRARRPLAKLKGRDPIPLQSMGDGMARLFEVAVGLVNVPQGGTFLVDELDSGLHFKVLATVWEMVFRTAVKLDIQVFATTHSWDCIKAFQTAAAADPAEGVLVRLTKLDQEIFADCFDEEQLATITRGSVEVR